MSIDYKINLDTASLTKGSQAVNGVSQATGALSSLLRGDFVSAATLARTAFVALRGAMMANPFSALAAAVVTVGLALASVAWRKHKEEIEELKRATDELADAAERYQATLKRIEFKNAAKSAQTDIKKAEMEDARAAMNEVKNRSVNTPSEAVQRSADLVAARERFIQAQDEWNDAAQAEAKDRLESEQKFRSELDGIAQRVKDAAESEKKARDALISSLEKRAAEAAEKRSVIGQTPEERLAAMQARKNALSAEFDGSANQARLDALAGGQDFNSPLVNLADPVAVQRAKTEMEELQYEIDLLSESLQKAAAAAQSAADEEALLSERLRASKLATIDAQEADYEFSKLGPAAQIAAIDERKKEIIAKEGWEQDADSRSEMLNLRKRRDAAEQRMNQNRFGGGTTSREMSIEEVIDRDYERQRARGDDVIRMRGSRAGGFVDDDGVQRMRLSLAGGFSSRLLPSGFARTAEEIEDKRRRMLGNDIVTTGAEQPVELKGEAVGLLRKISESLTKE